MTNNSYKIPPPPPHSIDYLLYSFNNSDNNSDTLYMDGYDVYDNQDDKGICQDERVIDLTYSVIILGAIFIVMSS